MSAREWIGWIVGTLVVAVVVHVGSVYFLPRAIMHVALSRMGGVNAIHHQGRVTARSRGVVRPSPDLLYSACPFDLRAGPLEVKAPIPPDTYWSASAFDANTNNFFAINDRTVGGQPLELIILPPGDKNEPPHFAGQLVVHAPTMHGLVLFRTLISDEKHFAQINAVRREANCAVYGKSSSGSRS
jgi:uncharacterized membrane protein